MRGMWRAFCGLIHSCTRPLVPLSLGLLAGIYFAYQYHWEWWTCAIVLGWIAFQLRREKNLSARFWSLIAAGWILAGVSVWIDLTRREYEFHTLIQQGRSSEFICQIGSPVQARRRKYSGVRYSFRAALFATADGEMTVRRMKTQVNWYAEKESLGGRAPKPGEFWKIKGTVQQVPSRLGGLPELRVNTSWRGAEAIPVPNQSVWNEYVQSMRKACAKRSAIGIEDWGIIPMLNQAMLLGARGELPRKVRAIFADSGTIHVFAISGMHIVLVAAIMILVISMLRIPYMYWVYFLAPMLIFYTVITGAPASAVRACVMSILYSAAPLLGRKPDPLSVLCGTAIGVYGWNPSLFFNAGCQLSFFVMVGLVLFCQPFNDWFLRLFREERVQEKLRLYQAAKNKKGIRRMTCLSYINRFMAGNCGVTCAAWLVSIPLTAAYFGRFTPGGLLANLVVAPASMAVVVGGVLGMVCSTFSLTLAAIFNHAAGSFTLLMVKVAEWTVALPYGSLKVPRWPAWAVLLWFVFIFLWALYLKVRKSASDSSSWLDD